MPVVQVRNSLSFPSQDVFFSFLSFSSLILLFYFLLYTFHFRSYIFFVLQPFLSNNFAMYLNLFISATPFQPPSSSSFLTFIFLHVSCCFFRSNLCKHSNATYFHPVSVSKTISNALVARCVSTNSRQRGETSGFSIQMAAICSR